ncbi:MAG: GNAT family N-acetyltransferase [Spirochaetales bacterium]
MSSTRSVSYEIVSLSQTDADDACDLWSHSVRRLGGSTAEIGALWKGSEIVRGFIEGHGRSGAGVVAREAGTVVAFLAYDRFPFHGEDTAVVPIVGHARGPGVSARIYQAMYRVLADVLVADGCLNHILTYPADDVELQKVAFELGFGLYVVDAFVATDVPEPRAGVPGPLSIRRAGPTDVDELHRLIVEFDGHYRGSPLFLCRDRESVEEIAEIVRSGTGAVFLAETDGRIAGFINVQLADESSPITLVREGMGLIEPLGAYIRPEYRRRGVGAALVHEALRWCRERGVLQVHVDFESANLEAGAFWPKHFTPTLHSVKRRLNQDILDSPPSSG